MFKTKRLPVEFLTDNKLVFQEYSHLKTIKVRECVRKGDGIKHKNNVLTKNNID